MVAAGPEIPRLPEIASIALGGTAAADGERFIMVLGLIDDRVLESGSSKLFRESLQVEAFQAAWPRLADYGYAPGSDPPDFILSRRGVSIALEVTQLTLQDFRRDLSQAREISRKIWAAVDGNRDFQHLTGLSLRVSLIEIPRRTEIASVVHAVLGAASKDVGYIGEDMDFSDGFPESWESNRGFHGTVGNAIVTVENRPHGTGIDVIVGLANPGVVMVADVVRSIERLVALKDRPENEALLITCGLPDPAGYVCPADSYLYEALRDYQLDGARPPAHLSAVYLHHWPTHNATQIYSRDTSGWPTCS